MAEMGEKQNQRSKEERYYYFEKQEVSIDAFQAAGRILDIGGGGEGIIGKVKGEQVIVIDPSRRELEEAPSGPLKIVMDARELKFLDCSFETVTSFFTLMYISDTDHDRVFSEVYRVLTPGGKFMIWDVIIPPCTDETKDIAVFMLKIKLPKVEIETGYGAQWPKQGRKMAHFYQVAQRVGFDVLEKSKGKRQFFMNLQKL